MYQTCFTIHGTLDLMKYGFSLMLQVGRLRHYVLHSEVSHDFQFLAQSPIFCHRPSLLSCLQKTPCWGGSTVQ